MYRKPLPVEDPEIACARQQLERAVLYPERSGFDGAWPDGEFGELVEFHGVDSERLHAASRLRDAVCNGPRGAVTNCPPEHGDPGKEIAGPQRT